MTALLKIEDLWIEGMRPGGTPVPIVRGIDLEVGRGEVVALIGESGAGKSTLALSALAYIRPGCRVVKGRVIFDGMDLLSLPAAARRAVRGRRIAYVAQSAAAAFNPALKIGSQVVEPQVIHRVPPEQRAAPADLYRKLRLPEPESIGERYPHQVSGGQLQRLMIAMAMACGPELLVFDEPTTALDVTTQIEVLATIKRVIREFGTAAIFVSHDLAVVAQVADRILVLLNGETVEEGTTAQIIHAPKAAYTRELMAAVRPIPQAVAHGLPVGTGPSAAKPVLELRRVTAGYGRSGAIALGDASVQVPRGKVVAVVGESGSGKTTLARAACGLLRPRAGEILLHGQPLAGLSAQRSRDDLRRIQIVFQMPDTSLNPKQTVSEILGRPLQFYFGHGRDTRKRRIDELLRMVELSPDLSERRPGELSGGQKQRVAIARALAAEPDLIVCDEVTSSLDTVVGAAIIETLRRLKETTGVSLIFISHDLSTVAAIADEVYVMYGGRVAECGTTEQVFSPPHHPYTKLLISSVPELRQGWLEAALATRESTALEPARLQAGQGCSFEGRCSSTLGEPCGRMSPELSERRPGHKIACHHGSPDLVNHGGSRPHSVAQQIVDIAHRRTHG